MDRCCRKTDARCHCILYTFYEQINTFEREMTVIIIVLLLQLQEKKGQLEELLTALSEAFAHKQWKNQELETVVYNQTTKTAELMDEHNILIQLNEQITECWTVTKRLRDEVLGFQQELNLYEESISGQLAKVSKIFKYNPLVQKKILDWCKAVLLNAWIFSCIYSISFLKTSNYLLHGKESFISRQ
jgi:hypothetical protein